MKNRVILTLISLFVLNVFMVVPVMADYVVTENDTIFCDEVKVGPLKTVLIMPDGEKITLKTNEVVTYNKDGRFFELRPEVKNNKLTDKKVFMEVMMQRGEYKMLRWECLLEGGMDIKKCKYYPTRNKKRYFIFKGDNFVVEMNENNKQHLFDFFKHKNG